MRSAAAVAAAFLLTIEGFFRLDNVTHMASVELWVLLTTVLLVMRFLLDFFGPWYANQLMLAIILAMEVLNHSLVTYTIGLMQLSGTRVNDYFQAWAVLLVTLQYSVKIGRPYSRSKQVPLMDLMSSFWSANLLRVQAFFLLRFSLWLVWSLNAARIILFFVSSDKAETINQESMRLVSDYMSSKEALSGDDDQKASTISGHKCAEEAPSANDDQKKFDMRGYKYLVHGEHLVLKEVQKSPQQGRTLASCFKRGTREEHKNASEPGRSHKILLRPDHEHKKQLVTVEKIWNNEAGESGLLGGTADCDNLRKDMCLSFALYKLLRRRFYNLPMHEVHSLRGKEKISRLVFGYILDKDWERAFRITEVELSFLQDLFYSKHATMFAGGFLIPATSLLLSLSLAAATGYIAYPVRYIPERMDQADRNRITHGVFITRLMVAIIVVKELGEIYLYVFSRWVKVLMLCNYVQQQWLRLPVVEMAMRLMFNFSSKAPWKQRIGQHNLLVLSCGYSLGSVPPFTFRIGYCRGHIPGIIHLEDYMKCAIFDSLSNLKKDRSKLGKYLANTFGSKQKLAWTSGLKIDTHIILVWHIATCLCEIEFFDEVKALKAVQRRARPFVRKPEARTGKEEQSKGKSLWCEQYAVAVSLSNYCAYLVSRALVPDNGMVAKRVLDEVIREIDHVTSNVGMRSLLFQPLELLSRRKNGGARTNLLSMEDVYECLMTTVDMPGKDEDPHQGGQPDVEAPKGGDQEADSVVPKQEDNCQGCNDLDIRNSLTKMGAKLGKQLAEEYNGNTAGLWRHLAEFWTGFLLHLAVSTRAAKHKTYLAGSGELITHLWALLSHAGFLGSTSHDEQVLDPVDLQIANPFME